MKKLLLILLICISCADEKRLYRGTPVPDAVQEEIDNTILDGRPFPKTTEFDYGFWHYKYTFRSHFNYSGIRTRN